MSEHAHRDEPCALERMLELQRDLQVKSFGLDPAELFDDEERIEFIRWNFLALFNEINEALQEIGWKPWAISRHVREDEVLDELVDAWHFFMNILWATYGQHVLGDAGALADAFTERYLRKREVNAQRQRDGYTGIKS